MKDVWIGKTRVVIHKRYTVVTLPNGQIVTALHKEQLGQKETAAHIGCSVEEMNRTHDLLHVMLAHMIGLDYSPTLADVAVNLPKNDIHGIEEAAVLAVQRFAQSVGKLKDLAP